MDPDAIPLRSVQGWDETTNVRNGYKSSVGIIEWFLQVYVYGVVSMFDGESSISVGLCTTGLPTICQWDIETTIAD